MAQEFLEVNEDIAVLLCELKPMRERANKLEQTLLSSMRFSSGMTGGSALIELSRQCQHLSSVYNDAKARLSTNAGNFLLEEMKRWAQVCQMFESSRQALLEETTELREEIAAIQDSVLYQEGRRQRQRLVKLSEQCSAARERHAALKYEIVSLQGGMIGSTESQTATEALMLTLDEARRRRFERLDAYLKLRDRQIKELDAASKVLLEKPAIGRSMSPDSSVAQDDGETFHIPTRLESNWISHSGLGETADSPLFDPETSDSLILELDVSEEEEEEEA
jgi:hypothetical protein